MSRRCSVTVEIFAAYCKIGWVVYFPGEERKGRGLDHNHSRAKGVWVWVELYFHHQSAICAMFNSAWPRGTNIVIYKHTAVRLSHKSQLPDCRPLDLGGEAAWPWLLRHRFCVPLIVTVRTQVFLIEKVALGQFFLRIRRFSPLGFLIPQALHTHTFK